MHRIFGLFPSWEKDAICCLIGTSSLRQQYLYLLIETVDRPGSEGPYCAGKSDDVRAKF